MSNGMNIDGGETLAAILAAHPENRELSTVIKESYKRVVDFYFRDFPEDERVNYEKMLFVGALRIMIAGQSPKDLIEELYSTAQSNLYAAPEDRKISFKNCLQKYTPTEILRKTPRF